MKKERGSVLTDKQEILSEAGDAGRLARENGLPRVWHQDKAFVGWLKAKTKGVMLDFPVGPEWKEGWDDADREARS